jgi:HAD superfamily hydrolase (TIGR01509 family)
MGPLAMGGVNAADLDAVTLDAYGTLVELRDPIPELSRALAEREQPLSEEQIRTGFHAEVAYYRQHSASGHDEAGLKRLQRDCAEVFLNAAGANLDAEEFAPVYASAMRFDVLAGVVDALERLRALGLTLAVVANWDLSLRRLLDDVDLTPHFATIVHAARKPAPDGLVRALTELHVKPERALHVGDGAPDEQAARAAGVRFARAPLLPVVSELA